MYEITVVIAVVLMLVSAFDYVRRVWQGSTNPVPATWILLMMMFTLSFWMYWLNPNKTWTGNIGVTSGIVNIFIVLTGVIAANIKHGTLRIAFDNLQKGCLAAGGAVVVFWYFTDEPLVSYVLVQVIGLIAYIATVKRLWNAQKTTEPLFLWLCVLLANFCALYPALIRNDLFSWIYLGRAIPSTIGVVFLISRLKWKNGELFLLKTGR